MQTRKAVLHWYCLRHLSKLKGDIWSIKQTEFDLQMFLNFKEVSEKLDRTHLRWNILPADRITILRSSIWSADRISILRLNIWSVDPVTILRSNIWSTDWNSILEWNLLFFIFMQSADRISIKIDSLICKSN